MRTAVLIHGFHLDSSLKTPEGRKLGWRDLVLGKAEPWLIHGRASYGVFLAYTEGADAVVFSTGASEKDGLKEAEVTYREVLKAADEIGEAMDVSGETLRAWLKPRARLDVVSQTTSEELESNLRWCQEKGLYRVILVTNRFHAPRALANANDVRKRLGLHMLRIFACAPEDGSPAPTVFEPATRPDRPGFDWHGTLKRIFALPPERQAEAFARIESLLAPEAP